MIYIEPKIDWIKTDGIADSDLNRIEGNIAYLKDDTESMHNEISSLSATGIPKLVSFDYDITATTDNQTVFTIPYEHLSLTTDTVEVFVNGIAVPDNYYIITEPVEVESAITLGFVTLTEPKPIGTIVKVRILKNVPNGDEGSVDGDIITVDSIPVNRINSDELDEFMNNSLSEVNATLKDLTQNMDNKQDINYQQITDGTDLNNLKAYGKRYGTTNNQNARSCLNIPRTNVLSFELYIPQTSPPVDDEPKFMSQILVEWNGNIWTRFYNEASTTSKWSDWVLIGGEQKSLDSGWKDISFDVGTINVQPQYRKKDNIVSFRGRITGITVAETTILTLPVGYRPSKNIYEIVSISNGRYSTIVITSTGQIIISSNSDNTYNTTDIYRLDNINFIAD